MTTEINDLLDAVGDVSHLASGAVHEAVDVGLHLNPGQLQPLRETLKETGIAYKVIPSYEQEPGGL